LLAANLFISSLSGRQGCYRCVDWSRHHITASSPCYKGDCAALNCMIVRFTSA